MGKLLKLSTEPFVYDWQSIADENQRLIAKSCVNSYAEKVKDLWKKAIKLQRDDTYAKALCVYHLKTHLDHGLFIDVCQRALNLNKDTVAALASVGKEIHQGRLQGDVLELVRRMEPRAANKLLKASPETKHRHVATFQATGQVPSRRALQGSPEPSCTPAAADATSDADVLIIDVDPVDAPTAQLLCAQSTLLPTASVLEARQRIKDANIRLIDLCLATAELLRLQSKASDEAQGALRSLRHQIDYLLSAAVTA